MTTRAIPYKLPALLLLGSEALVGATTYDGIIEIAQNTAPRIAADHYDLFGEPGENPINRGKQAALNAKRDAVTAARAARRAARSTARQFCANAVDLFKGHLGRSWNSAWAAAGFTQFTISVSTADVPTVLMEVRNYLRENPARENVPAGITAALADAQLTAVQAANSALNTAIANRSLAAEARDAAVQTLRERLSGLREELERLIEDTDPRWYEFGFARPVDLKMPAPVTGLMATPGLPGQVLVQHEAAARAIDYRVSWKVVDASGDPTVVGLFADLAVTLTGLPSGLTIVVSVTARNEAGETQPVNVAVLVP